MREKIVISAVNLREGGPLAILQECLEAASRHFGERYEIIALVHRRDLFSHAGVTYREFPLSAQSWLKRLYYEYLHFMLLSRRWKPALWLSLHDITPNVSARCRAVYCHNSAPFFTFTPALFRVDRSFALFTLFYRYLYRLNIHKNDFVIVQQEWLRRRFAQSFPISGRIVVAHPESRQEMTESANGGEHRLFRFLYPAFPRVFKNFEVVCEAAQLLQGRGVDNFEVLLTINGTENRYARLLAQKYRGVSPLRFMGVQPKSAMQELYAGSDCLLFPSKLESWGLPLREFKNFGRAMLVADLPYAHETVGGYDKVKFFPPDDALALSRHMEEVMTGTLCFDSTSATVPAEPFAADWRQLFQLLLGCAGAPAPTGGKA